MPHNIYLAMFSPASVNVLAFDPNHGADQARGYAGKYCSKPERYFFMESEKNGVKFWLRARTVGLCATFNRLLGYHVVRNTKPVISLSPSFVRDTEYSAARSQAHLARYPLIPDPLFHLGLFGKYYFRSQSLLHLRIEQFNRYLHLDTRDAELTGASCVGHDEVDDAEDTRFVETDHRHFDAFMEGEPPGKKYQARRSGVPSAKRRMHARLGVTRTWNMEPIGKTREVFYEQRLVQGLAWFVDSAPELVVTGSKQAVRWVLKWAQPASLAKYGIDSIALQISSNGSRSRTNSAAIIRERIQLECVELGVSMLRRRTGSRRLRCVPVRRGFACLQSKRDLGASLALHDAVRRTEMRPLSCVRFCSHHFSLFPCAAVLGLHPCMSVCVVRSGQLDVQRCIFNLHRRLFPIDVIRSKAQAF